MQIKVPEVYDAETDLSSALFLLIQPPNVKVL